MTHRHTLLLAATSLSLSIPHARAQQEMPILTDHAPKAGSGLKVPDAGTEPGPSIFTAIQEQLGLKLQPSKGPVDTLILDHADPPSEN